MTKSPHFWWLISLLVATIIGLIAFIVTERICCSESLMNYVSVCSVLISITLSVFAIQYTYTSNNQVNQQFQKINAAADSITSTSAKLAGTNELLTGNLKQIIENIEGIKKAQQAMSSKIGDITNPKVNTTVNNYSARTNENKESDASPT